MAVFKYSEWWKFDMIKDREKDKNTLRKKGENVLYARLKMRYKNGKMPDETSIHDYVESLKAEIKQEDENNKNN